MLLHPCMLLPPTNSLKQSASSRTLSHALACISRALADCPQLLNTMQLLARHYARKHMEGERLFACACCQVGQPPSPSPPPTRRP